VTEQRLRFETRVNGIWGEWPAKPALWSYSSLSEMEECPQRWMLSRAKYPGIWPRSGYPPLPSVPVIFGRVVHGVVEQLTEALSAAGITEPASSDVTGVLGALGGWHAIVLRAIEREVAELTGNPRASAERVARVNNELQRRADEAADQVKGFLGRGVLPPWGGSKSGGRPQAHEPSKQRFPARQGVHAEREVTAESLRLTGTIDRLLVDDSGVTIIDFKTGRESEAHDDQVRLYALLWTLDRQSNPDGQPVTRLCVAYSSFERSVPSPDSGQLQALEETTADRVAAADRLSATPPPPAYPSETTCQFCRVKHLCEPYWQQVPPVITDAGHQEWLDFEGVVLRPNGSRSWLVTSASEPFIDVLVRTSATDVPFRVGERVRLLGVRRDEDPDEPERMVVSMTGASEWYPVAS